jgi:hypothetical protein
MQTQVLRCLNHASAPPTQPQDACSNPKPLQLLETIRYRSLDRNFVQLDPSVWTILALV